jgi:hypothetical protein
VFGKISEQSGITGFTTGGTNNFSKIGTYNCEPIWYLFY